MIPFLIPALSWMSANRKLVAIVGAALLVVLIVAGVSHHATVKERHRLEADAANAQAAALVRDERAKATADLQRRADDAANVKATKELTDAYAKTPDSRPAGARLLLACQRLRNAGQDVSNLPECGGSEGPAKAHPDG